MVAESAKSSLSRAMSDPDRLVCVFEYEDRQGRRTRRVVSPIRFTSSHSFLGLCLSREAPRRFDLERCRQLMLAPAHRFTMPLPELPLADSGDVPLATQTVS